MNDQTADSMYYMCVNVSSITTYLSLTIKLTALVSPSVNSAFSTAFLSMYTDVNGGSRTRAAKDMYSYFSCRASSRWPTGASDSTWQLQYYETGTLASPPPPSKGHAISQTGTQDWDAVVTSV